MIYTDDPRASSIYAALWSRPSLGKLAPLVVRRKGCSTTELVCDYSGCIGVDQLTISHRHAHELMSEFFGGSPVAYEPGTQYFTYQGCMSEDARVVLRFNWRFTWRCGLGCTTDDLADRILVQVRSVLVDAEAARMDVKILTGPVGPDDRIYVAFQRPDLQRHLHAHSHPAGLKLLRTDITDFDFYNKRRRIHNCQWSDFGDVGLAKSIGLFTAAYALYGALHLAAWNGPFRTATEGILWKISAVGVSLSLILEEVLLLSQLGMLFLKDWVPSQRITSRNDIKKHYAWRALELAYKPFWYCLLLLIFALMGLICCFLIFCRIYLVVESFISLVFVPETVFAVPQWSTYFPHIS